MHRRKNCPAVVGLVAAWYRPATTASALRASARDHMTSTGEPRFQIDQSRQCGRRLAIGVQCACAAYVSEGSPVLKTCLPLIEVSAVF